MSQGITYQLRLNDQVLKTDKISEVFTPWCEKGERWLFVAPHDDDIVCGCGLTFQAAIVEGVEVHAMVTTDGRMGYCRPEHRRIISQVRRCEAEKSYQLLGLPLERLHFLGFPDGGLNYHLGRRFAAVADPVELENASGMQNSYTYMLRKIRPTRVFLPTITDLHPDHRMVHEEMLVSLFHAQGNIWPELGEPIESVPPLYEYATYCDFLTPPQIRLVTPPALLERKLDGIMAYASQEQIGLLVDVTRKAGPVEYIRQTVFNVFQPSQYEKLFQ